MREIKFRAWESRQNKMDYNPYGDEMICEGTPINLLFSSPMDGQILMQYTGLRDKNCRERAAPDQEPTKQEQKP